MKIIFTENNYPDIQGNVHLNIHRQQWRWFDKKSHPSLTSIIAQDSCHGQEEKDSCHGQEKKTSKRMNMLADLIYCLCDSAMRVIVQSFNHATVHEWIWKWFAIKRLKCYQWKDYQKLINWYYYETLKHKIRLSKN